jgi:hypothetical protein
MITAVRDWIARGVPVFPCHTIRAEEDGCTCGERDCKNAAKHPRTWKGVRDATLDPEQVTAWWTRWPAANVGGAVGDAGYWVLDVDGPAGAASLADWLALRGYTLPPTLTTRTGGGGVHYWWRTGDRVPRNRVGVLHHVDVRSRGGYVILPPSLHRSGRRYELVDGAEIGDPPPWLVDLVAPPPPPPPPPAHPKAWYPDGGASVRLRDPSARRALAIELRGQIADDGTTARGMQCPQCGRRSAWFAVQPERWYGAACSHRQTCGWRGRVTDLQAS